MRLDTYLRVAAILLGAAAGEGSAQRARTNQNFVFFQPDEMRAESLGCYGHPVSQTPNFGKIDGNSLNNKILQGDHGGS